MWLSEPQVQHAFFLSLWKMAAYRSRSYLWYRWWPFSKERWPCYGSLTVLRKSDQPFNWAIFLVFFWDWPRDTAARPFVCLSCLSFFVLWCAHVIRGSRHSGLFSWSLCCAMLSCNCCLACYLDGVLLWLLYMYFVLCVCARVCSPWLPSFQIETGGV